jgi:hypothetical protein
MSKRFLIVAMVVVAAMAAASPAAGGQDGHAAVSRRKTAAPAVRAPLNIQYAEVTRLGKNIRQQIFAELTACHIEMRKKADALYPDMDVRTRGYSSKKDVKQFRERGQFENAMVAQCTQQAIAKHTIEAHELGSIKNEGICQQWPPLTGKPIC